jgi:hypothetical protein
MDIADTAREVSALRALFESERLTHMISIERLGPARDGKVYNMRGDDITGYTAPLHALFVDCPWTTIAIGDGGNEVGMGRVPHELVAAEVDLGEMIHCEVATEHLVVSGVSNWGAAAVLLAIGLLDRDAWPTAARFASPEIHERFVRTSVNDGGAVDGVSGRRDLAVDGLAIEQHTATLSYLAELAASSFPQAS